ncbi:uncharacterized protein LOC123904150 [Trifolium pratense]|uniref:uncharacterized protein LOC123901267 n=1 Tax=Trifolium pratense TaxID=57577 RepID=UPI001E695EA2|nr:uncharacterized protein LOC123901267 [Trifolium pratense]XP_045809799.1 uncharacterized protein LOC123904150 [Trifolium pratense]
MEESTRNRNTIHDTTLTVENLTLNDDEDELEITLDEESHVNKQSFNLVGRFLTNRPIRVNMMMGKMGDIWQPGRGMDVEEAYPGLFVFRFFHQLDVQHILKQGPWSFDNHTLVLNILSDDVDPRDVPLFNVPFWIQIHNLPSGFMSQKVGKNVGDYIGEFLEYDEKNDSLSWRKYMRIRVLIDVRLPLKKSKKIKKPGEESKLIQFKYERLGTFCYVCGLLGHAENKCPKLFDMETTKVVRGWGPELRAEMGKRQGSDSKWLRQGGNSNWIAPDPTLMRSQGGSNSTSIEEKTKANNAERVQKSQLAAIFSKPEALFPKPIENKNVKTHRETMDEDEVEVLIVEGDRKRSRSGEPNHVPKNIQVQEVPNSSPSTSDISNNEKNFLTAGPGGARRG